MIVLGCKFLPNVSSKVLVSNWELLEMFYSELVINILWFRHRRKSIHIFCNLGAF